MIITVTLVTIILYINRYKIKEIKKKNVSS